MRTLFLSILLCSLPASLLATDAKDFAGHYLCTGSNPTGHAYQVWFEVQPLEHVLILHQQDADSHEVWGVGVVRNNRLLAAFAIGNYATLATYQQHHKQLLGEWVLVGHDGVYTETCEPTTQTQPPQLPSYHAEHHHAQ